MGAAPVVCPECGRRVVRARQMRRTRRRWGVVILAAAIGLAAGWVAPVWATKGWIAAVPQPALDLVLQLWFAEEAERQLTSRAGATAWERAMTSWAVRKRLGELPRREELAMIGSDAEASRPSLAFLVEVNRTRTDCIMLFLVAKPHERRGLHLALARAAERCDGVRARELLLEPLARHPRLSSSVSDVLWRMAGSVEQPSLARDLMGLIRLTDPSMPQARETEAYVCWVERMLRTRWLSPAMWAVLIEVAARFDPSSVVVVEREVQRRPEQDLGEAVRILDEVSVYGSHQQAIHSTICRLVDHPDPRVRRACAHALFTAPGTQETLAALRRLADDEVAWIAALASEALARHEEAGGE